MTDTPRTDTEVEQYDGGAPEYVDANFARALERELLEARDWVRRLHKETQVLTCVFCGHAYPPNTPDSGSEVLTAHIRVCEKHPMRTVEVENTKLREALHDIMTDAHCIAKAGPLSVPTLDVAWNRFMHISVRAASALHRPTASALVGAVVEAQKRNHETPLDLD